MAAKQRNSRGGRIFFIVIAIVLSLVAVGIVGWNMFKYKFIKGKVNSTVFKKTNGLYTIGYDKMELDEVAGYLHVTHLSVVPDTARFRQLIAAEKNPALLVEVNIPELTIAGVKTPEALLSKKISGRRLEINNASVVFYYAKAHPDTSNAAGKQEIYQQLLGSLKEIQADTVEIQHVSLAFVDIRTNRKVIEASDISIHLKDVLIDSLHSNDSTRFLFARQLQVSGSKGIIKNKTGTYFYHFDDFSFNKVGGLFSVGSIRIAPQLSEEKFAAFSRLQNDRFNVSLQHISLSGINLARLMQSDMVADNLTIKDGSIKVFRDRTYPSDKIIRVGTFPQQLLMQVPFVLSVKKITVNNAFVEYKEKNPKSDSSGKIQFAHANAVISNVTNEPGRIKADNHCVLNFNARFLDMAAMHARIDMLLKNPQGRFLFSGSVDSFEAAKLNVVLQPMGLAKIEKGTVNKLNFAYTGYNYGSDGKVTLLYDDLKLTLLKKDDDDALKKKKLASFVANMIIKNSNPQGKKPVRVAEVHYQRNTNRSFFNLMWKSVYAGIKQTAGM